MKHLYQFSFILFLILGTTSPIQSQHMWYDEPADAWEKALPIGNGAFGAVIYGQVINEKLKLNHDTFWSGYPKDLTNPTALPYVDSVAQLVAGGNYYEADQKMRKMQGPYSQSYQPMGTLLLHYNYSSPVKDYSRKLDLQKAIATVNYTIEEHKIKRTIFASNPDDVIIYHEETDAPIISFDLKMNALVKHEATASKDIYILKVKAPKHVEPNYRSQFSNDKAVKFDEWEGEGMEGEIVVKVIAPKGEVFNEGQTIFVRKAKTVTLIIGAATSFNGRFKSPGLEGKNYHELVDKIIKRAAKKSFGQLKSKHIVDYQSLFNRTNLSLPKSDKDELTTDERILQFDPKQDLSLISLLYDYGRYLLIATSREGTQPANLQGIWSKTLRPPWSCNFTQNINIEMNYWPAEVNNLGSLAYPLFNLIKDHATKGTEIAKVNYGLDGWVTHHNGDLWAHCSPVGDFGEGEPRWANWAFGGAWLSQHLFDHYLFTGDIEFLKNYYPILKGASTFVMGLIRKNKNGKYETAFGTSPESAFIDPNTGESVAVAAGPASDLAMTNELLNNTLKAAAILNIDAPFRKKIKDIIKDLQPFRVNRDQVIMEWSKDFKEEDPHHRHMSHLYGLYPSNQINLIDTPELFEASRRSMIRRGNVSTGWSMGWKTNLWARLLNGDQAYDVIQNLIKPIGFGSYEGDGISFQTGGLYANLWDAHPPFQIDGNFGVTAGITEMLIQSHAGSIHLLPALPKEWKTGTFSGLKTRGNFTVNMVWKNNKVSSGTLVSNLGGDCMITSATPLSFDQSLTMKKQCHNPLFDTTPIDYPELFGLKKIALPAQKDYYTYCFATKKGQQIRFKEKR